MAGYLRQRLLLIIPVMFGVSLLSFLLTSLVPGDPVLILLGENTATPERYAELQRDLGLDQPWFVQYGRFALNALRGDFGYSFRSNRSVLELVVERLPA